MTKRLDNCVVCGELDNWIPGRVSGTLWLNGLAKPVELDLKGDAMRDLAGHRITFSRKDPPSAVMENGEWEEPVPHPLAEECSELGFKISQDLRDSDWLSPDFVSEHPPA